MDSPRTAASSISALVVALLVCSGAGPWGGEAVALTGGPDAFGYRYADSAEPAGPPYNFEDISNSGSHVNLSDDEVSGAIYIGFPFNFYGVDYNHVYIGSNGFLTFLPGQSAGSPSAIPDSAGPNAVIAGWAADLYPPDCGSIRYHMLGSSPSRRFIVQYTYIGHSPTGSGIPVTFEIKLFETTNDIEIHYSAVPSNGTTHSVGIENEAGSIGVQYYSGADSLDFPGAVRFYDSRFEGSPADDFYTNGPKGGPFGPASKTYTLTNSGMTPLNWSAVKTASWLGLSDASGTLQPHESTFVSLSINANAETLNDGTFTDTITFMDTSSGTTLQRTVTLLVSDFVSSSHPWPSLWYFGRDFYVDWTGYDVANSNFFFWRIDQSASAPVTVGDAYVPVTQHGLTPAGTSFQDGNNYFHLAATDTTTGQIIPGSQRNFSVRCAVPAPEITSSTHPSSSTASKSRDLSLTAELHSGSAPLFDGFEVGSFGTLPWVNYGWSVNGGYSAHSGNYGITVSGSVASSLQLSLRSRSISFWYAGWPTCRFYIDGVLARSLSNGSYTLYSFNDLSPSIHTFRWVESGNQNYSSHMDDITVDFIPTMPEASIQRYWYSVDSQANTEIQGTEQSTESLPITWPALPAGTWWLHVALEDTVGNLSQTAHRQLIVAPDQPSVFIWPQSNPVISYPYRDVEVSWNDGGAAIGQWAGYYYAWDDNYATEPSPLNTSVALSSSLTFTNQPIGVHYFHIRSIDKYGSLSPVVHQAVQIREATAPVISPTGLDNGVLMLTWSNPENFATHYYYRFDHDPDYEPVPDDPDVIRLESAARNEIGVTGGAWYAHVRGADAYDNLSRTGHWGVWAGPVSISISSPSATFAQANSTITYTVTYYGASAVTLSNADVLPVTTGSATVNSIQVSGAGTSTRTIALSGFSGQGAIGIALAAQTAHNGATPPGYAPETGPSRTFSVDTVPPAVDLTSPEPQFTKTTPIPVTITFTEPVVGFNLSKLIVANGEVQNLGPTGDDRVWNVELAPAAQGNVTIDIAAGAVTDAAGNPSLSAPQFSRTYDTTPPTGSLLIGGGDEWTMSRQVGLTLNATDGADGVGVEKMRFSLNGQAWGVWENYAANHTIELDAGDGLKTVYVQFMDGLENASGSFSDTITLDETAPECSVLVNDGADWTSTGSVVLSIAAMDAGSGIRNMQVTNDETVWSDPVPFVTSKPWTLNAGDGPRTVWVRLGDNAGNTHVCSDEINVDQTAPAGKVTINADSEYTNSLGVTLGLEASDGANGIGLLQMRLSNNESDWSEWEDFGASRSWTLAGDDGNKTVYVQFRDALGNTSASVSDSIVLDTTPPGVTLTSAAGEFVNAAFDVSATFTEPVVGCEVEDVSVANGAVSGFGGSGASYHWTVQPNEDGAVVVSVAASVCTDAAGSSNTASNALQTTYDHTLPTGALVIDEGAEFTASVAVNLALSAEDGAGSGVAEMRLSNDQENWTVWEPLAASKVWDLSQSDGAKTVYAQVRDAAANVSETFGDSITLDTAAPAGALAINDGAAYTNTREVTLTLSASDGENGCGVSDMCFSLDGTTWGDWEAFGAERAWTLSEGDGTKTVYVRLRDALGNASGAISDSIDLDTVPPTVVVGAPSLVLTSTRPVEYVVSYDGAHAINLTAADISLIRTGTADGTVAVSGEGSVSRIVTVSAISGKGSFGIAVSEGTAVDAAGNVAGSAGPSALTTVIASDVDGDGSVNAMDVQLVINAALGRTADPGADLNGDGFFNAMDVQMVINAALGRI